MGLFDVALRWGEGAARESAYIHSFSVDAQCKLSLISHSRTYFDRSSDLLKEAWTPEIFYYRSRQIECLTHWVQLLFAKEDSFDSLKITCASLMQNL